MPRLARIATAQGESAHEHRRHRSHRALGRLVIEDCWSRSPRRTRSPPSSATGTRPPASRPAASSVRDRRLQPARDAPAAPSRAGDRVLLISGNEVGAARAAAPRRHRRRAGRRASRCSRTPACWAGPTPTSRSPTSTRPPSRRILDVRAAVLPAAQRLVQRELHRARSPPPCGARRRRRQPRARAGSPPPRAPTTPPAAAAVLTGEGHENTVYELSGDTAWSFAEYAAEVSRQTGKEIPYRDVSPQERYVALTGRGGRAGAGRRRSSPTWTRRSRAASWPRPPATCPGCIGRPTTPLADAIAVALKELRRAVRGAPVPGQRPVPRLTGLRTRPPGTAGPHRPIGRHDRMKTGMTAGPGGATFAGAAQHHGRAPCSLEAISAPDCLRLRRLRHVGPAAALLASAGRRRRRRDPRPPHGVVAARRWSSSWPCCAAGPGSARCCGSPGRLGLVPLAAAVISVNWGLYIWAVNAGHVLEASLGYFINPLVSIAFGVLLLRERLRPRSGRRSASALVAVAVLTVGYGKLPWISLDAGLLASPRTGWSRRASSSTGSRASAPRPPSSSCPRSASCSSSACAASPASPPAAWARRCCSRPAVS